MRVAILGPPVVEHDGAYREVAGERLQALLARLALDPGRAVSRGALVETLWDGDPPRDEQHALQSLVSRLRRALGDPGLVVQEAAGHRLAVAPEEVDAVRFERLARDGGAALRAGDAARAERLLTEALALWRGAPATDADRLGELRLTAQVDRLTAIAVGDELAELTARSHAAHTAVRVTPAAGRSGGGG
jgi:DNA-binding SARP family transcriptional activator